MSQAPSSQAPSSQASSSQAPSSSKTAAIAGTLAGLLAAGLGVYYLHLQRHPEPVAQKAAANHDVGNAAAGNKPALILAQADTSATAVPAAKAARSKEQASLALLALPELTSWSAQLEKNSGGKWHGALIEDDPAPRIVNGKTYYQFSFVEDGADSVHRLESFLAAANSDDILVEDDSSDELLSLERWRKEKHPMQRVVGGGN